MTGKHRALIVEDDRVVANDLAEILKSFGCGSRIATNKRDALAALKTNSFCVILLDLQIKREPDSIKGHTENGNTLLREIRRVHSDHTGLTHWLPILIVSGFAREGDTAVEVMKDGADDVVHKPFKSREVSDKVRDALERSGRRRHELCGAKPPAKAPDPGEPFLLAIPGARDRRRSHVLVGSRPVRLTNRSLKVLLRLMVAQLGGGAVHKRELGAKDDRGFKGISELRHELGLELRDDVIGNDYHGNYYLTAAVTIGDCNTAALVKIGDATITRLARKLRSRLDARGKKSEGNS